MARLPNREGEMAQEPMSGGKIEEVDLFYEEVRNANSRPLWMMGSENLTTEPRPKTSALIWRWRDLRPLMYRAARLVPVE
jgi:gentisate 1,2-dioxygenase